MSVTSWMLFGFYLPLTLLYFTLSLTLLGGLCSWTSPVSVICSNCGGRFFCVILIQIQPVSNKDRTTDDSNPAAVTRCNLDLTCHFFLLPVAAQRLDSKKKEMETKFSSNIFDPNCRRDCFMTMWHLIEIEEEYIGLSRITKQRETQSYGLLHLSHIFLI